jgi:chemotaxis response regulator CheB
MMTRKRVLLIESGRFLGGVIHDLFARFDKITVFTARPSSARNLLAEVHANQPDIVVMDDTLGIQYLAHLLRYMQNDRNISVFIVNTESNQVQIFQKQEINLTQSQDLFAIL